MSRPSSSQDREIGEPVANAFDKVGKDGVISVEESTTTSLELEFTEGMQFDKGFISAYFVTDPDRMETVFEDASILLVQGKISSVQEQLPLLEKVVQAGKPLLIIAEDVEGEAIEQYPARTWFVTYSIIGAFPFYSIDGGIRPVDGRRKSAPTAVTPRTRPPEVTSLSASTSSPVKDHHVGELLGVLYPADHLSLFIAARISP